eukprot:gene3645-3906_t
MCILSVFGRQDYLHQARHPTQGPASRSAYHFTFYLQPTDADQSFDSTISGSTPSFQLVVLTLAPPPPSRSGAGALSPAARKALHKLLELCGLPAVQDEDEGTDAQSAACLTNFLPGAAEVVRQHESGVTQHEVQMANLRAALRLARQVIAGFQPNMFSPVQQVELLQRLAAALDLLWEEPPDLSGLRVLICGRTALDSQGNLLLDAQQSEEEWADFLGGVDLQYARGKAESTAALRKLESRVAGAMGVRMLFTAAAHLMTHEYRGFLERLAAHVADHGPANGQTAAAILAQKQELQQEIADTTTTVRTRLGLRRLLKDDLISNKEFQSCCKRLLHHHDQLLRCNIEGLSIRVSDKNRVSDDGQLVEIAWNFEL